MHDVCVIIVSHDGKRWLDAALCSLFESAGGLDLDVVVVDNGSDGSAAYVEEHFPRARTITCLNRGFGAANNEGLATADARYVLFLNPDTEFLDGNLAEQQAGRQVRGGEDCTGHEGGDRSARAWLSYTLTKQVSVQGSRAVLPRLFLLLAMSA